MRRLCLTRGCSHPAKYRGRCRIHSAKREQATHPNRALYSSKRWRMLRRKRLGMNPLCPCGAIATDVDHITPIEEGGPPFSLANTRSLCHSCHSKVTRQAQLRA